MKRVSPRMFALIFAVCFLVAIPFGIKAVHDQHAQTEAPDVAEPVSYTHLTLPTILLV